MWFQNDWVHDTFAAEGSDLFLRHPDYLEAAREFYGAEVVEPTSVYVNLMADFSRAGAPFDRYLIEDHTLVFLPSASALPFIQENKDNPLNTPLILGNPLTNDPSLDSLPFATTEAEAIAGFYGEIALLADAATETAVKKEVPHAGILHIAAHGIYDPNSPMHSRLALAAEGENEGDLHVSEVYGLDLQNTGLVVLSACQTQVGELIAGGSLGVSPGDELTSLTRAFFFAGTPSVIASLWNVNDAATALLMERFYTHLQAGMSKAAALRQAQLDTQKEFPNPYFWAGFVLSGDGGEIGIDEGQLGNNVAPGATPTPVLIPPDEPEPTPGWLWLVIIGAATLTMGGGFFLGWRKRREA